MNTRSFFWSKFFVGGLVICTALLTVSGVAAQYFDLGADWNDKLEMLCAASFAGIAAFALGTSQMAAAMAQALAESEDHKVAFRMAVVCAVICAFISVGGVHMGALVLGLNWVIMDIGGVLLAVVKPLMSVVIEAGSQIERAKAKAAKEIEDANEFELRKTAIESARPAPAPVIEDLTESPEPKPAPKRASAAQARAVSRALRNAPQSRARSRAGADASRKAPPTLPLTDAELEMAVASLTNAGKVVSLASVARAAATLLDRHVPESRVERHPKRQEIFARYAKAS